MPANLATSLERAVAFEFVNLSALTGEQAAVRPSGADSWSRKEELGHLIDSDVHNHVRFVKASFDRDFSGTGYSQYAWSKANGYNELHRPTLIYNSRPTNSLLV